MVHLRRGLLTFGVLASAAPAVITSGDVFSCLTSYQVPFYTNQSSNWTSLVTPFNLRLIFEPDVITIPLTTVDVSNSVICASRAGLKVQAKGGGHSYASYSSGGLNGSMIVNLQGLQSVNIDNGTGIATVGGGARLGNMATAIYNQGQRALPHGTCPTVGIGGHFTHGGYGYASRLWGLALDSIVGLDVVLANGSFVHTSETQYPDIYYALRGAADSFGIVTTFYLQTLPAPRFVLYFDVEIPLAIQNVSTITNGFLQLQETVNDPEVVNGNLSFGITTDEKGTFEIKGWCIECNETIFGTTTLPALLKGFPKPESITIQPLGWLASLRVLAGGPLLVPATGPVGTGQNDTFYAKSLVTKTAQPLAAEEWNAFWSFVIDQGQGAKAPSPWFSIINLYGGAGSQINVPLSNSSAYPDRNALWVFQNFGNTINGQPPYIDATTPFIDNLTNSIPNVKPDNDFTAYLNYIDPDLTTEETINLYYEKDNYAKLLKLKLEYDPNCTFWNPQAVGMDVCRPGAGGQFNQIGNTPESAASYKDTLGRSSILFSLGYIGVLFTLL